MAKTSTRETVELQDGTNVELRPLNIKNYRLFQSTWDAFVKSDGEDKSEIDFLVDLVLICLSKPLSKPVDEWTDEDRDWLEDVLDSENINYIIKVCAGVDLNPSAAMVATVAAQTGQNSN